MEINFKGNTYIVDEEYWRLLGNDLNSCPQFQYEQLLSCIEDSDWVTLENRIINQIMLGGLIKK